ncbi:MAG: hypothetical protein KDC98_23270 [Planctomycetes bacterium]|nr:hypothetical protein [Planctomycetota bacterium]
MDTPVESNTGPSRRPGLLAACMLTLVVACATFVPQHGWDADTYGPVVPHDGFPADCTLCHAPGDWHTMRADFKFDHEAETGVALSGAHNQAGCLMCHNDRGPVAQFTARGCSGCHADPHLQRLGQNCKDCHNEDTWQPREAIAQHDRTRFPLVGSHAAVACFRCHAGAQVGNFAGASPDCGSCHMDDRTRSKDPDHILLNFSTDCKTCHLALDWKPARFSHPASFPLTHGHFNLECRQCHTTPNSFTGLSPACASCHSDEHAATTEPSHLAASFGTDCSECHTTVTFRQANWQHPAGFAMTFGHANRNCSECHTGQSYVNTSTDCVSCHLDNYQSTNNPNHVTAQLPQDCEQCHNTATWHGANIDHPASFQLENAHALGCNSCHTPPNYAGLSPDCYSCHQAQYQATTNPNHIAASYPQTCQQCHNTVTWLGAISQHPSSFPLENAHLLSCNSCHTPPNYSGLSPACYSCHQQQYQATTDPSHTAFQMSHQCLECHNTTAWNPSSFSHQFPITSGKHRNISCFSCHTNSANRSLFACIDCHEHNQQNAGSHHGGVNNYQWTTAACYSCHPQGRE